MFPKYSLTIMIGNKKPYNIELSEYSSEAITFGRHESNDIVIDSAIASNFHGVFTYQDEAVYITDKNSTNGIYVNSNRITAKTQLYPADSITFESEFAKGQSGEYGIVMVIGGSEPSGNWCTFKLTDKITTIGRDNKCDIVINQAGVSLYHAKILKENDKWFIVPSGSTSGVFINGNQIHNKSILTDRDVIFIGHTKILYAGGCIHYSRTTESVAIHVRNVSKTVNGKKEQRTILNHISVSISPNEFAAIIGGSGAGKSTLMNGMCGFSQVSDGQILFNSEDLYSNYSALKNLIGYVPQQDIVYRELTLGKMLDYTAQMRMPEDSTQKERDNRVAQVIEMVELDGREDTLIGSLSGGQRKRASIAVELISDPTAFFLDEPSSGLDPGTERHLMQTLKRMTEKNKTIIVVTHMTTNISLCDKIIVLGSGGRLCFFGTPDEALSFFNVTDFVDIYDKVNSNAASWQLRFGSLNTDIQNTLTAEQAPQAIKAKKIFSKSSFWRQFAVLCKRYTSLILADKKRIALLILQAPLLGLLLSLVSYNVNQAGKITVFLYSGEAKAFLFSLSCAAFWMGMLSSVQEICKERDIYKRERMANLKLLPYMLSKLTVLGILCMVQSVLLLTVVTIMIGSPASLSWAGVPPLLGMFITTFLTTFSATALGLLVSGLSPNPDRAMSLAPLILMPQILFSGVAFGLSGFAEFLSGIINCKWSVTAYCILSDINSLPQNSNSATAVFENVAYTADITRLLSAWGVLLFMAVVCTLACTVALKMEE